MALAARDSGLTAAICVPCRYFSPQIQAIKSAGSDVILHGETYEDAVDYSRRLAADCAWADCNPDGPFEAVLLDGLASRLERRMVALGELPDVLWLPLGNGTTALAALAVVDRLNAVCRVVAVTSQGNNSILSSWRQGRHVPLAACDLRETPANEPLCNWSAAHGTELLAKANDRLSVIGVADRDLVRAAAALRRLRRVRYTPSGSAGFAGYATVRPGPTRHAILLTARDPTDTTT